MLKQKNKLIALFFVLTLFLIGCGKETDAATKDEKPTEIRSDLLLFTQEGSDDNGTIGSLYIQNFVGEPELIAENVIEGHFYYDNDTGHVLFMDAYSDLYLYDSEDTIEIATNVSAFDVRYLKHGKIPYSTDDNYLHIYTGGSSTVIGEDIYDFEIVGDEIYYTTYQDNFYRFNLESKTEVLIDNNVNSFLLLSDEGELVYDNEDGGMYYLSSIDGDRIRIFSGWILLDSIKKEGNNLYFLERSNDSEAIIDLYRVNLEENYRVELLVNNVTNFDLSGENLYYSTPDHRLYKMEDLNANPQRLAIDVEHFELLNNHILVVDWDNTYYRFDEEDNSQTEIAKDVYSSFQTESDNLFYLNSDKELFYENIKLASNISRIGHFYDTIVYVDQDTLKFKNDSNEAVELTIDIDEYTTIYYQNKLVYENLLELEDIVGPYTFDNGYEQSYLEFTEDEELYFHDHDASLSLTVNYNSIHSMSLESHTGETVYVTLSGDDLEIEYNGRSFFATPTTPDIVEEYVSEKEKREAEEERRREREEKELEATYVVIDFVYDLPDAVNYGTYNYISHYIDPSSDLYTSQEEFVENAYNAGITESLVDMEVLDFKLNEDGTAQVLTVETFDIQNASGNESRSEYEALYDLKQVDGEFLITNLSVQ